MQEIDKHQIDQSLSAGFLSPCCLGVVKNVPIWGVCSVSGRCLGGVWGLSE